MGKLVALNANNEEKKLKTEQPIATTVAQGRRGKLMQTGSASAPVSSPPTVYRTSPVNTTPVTRQNVVMPKTPTQGGTSPMLRQQNPDTRTSYQKALDEAMMKRAAADRKNRERGRRSSSRSHAQEVREITGDRTKTDVGSLVKSAAAGYAADMVGAADTLLRAPSGLNYAASQERREIEASKKNIAAYTEKLKAAKTEEERQQWHTLIDRNKRLIEINSEYAGKQTENYRNLTKGAQETLQRTYQNLRSSAAENMQKANEGQNAVGQLLNNVAVAGMQMGADIAAGLGRATVPMATRVFGGSSQEAMEEGIQPDMTDAERLDMQNRALLYGAGSAGVSVLSEKLSNVAAPFKKAFGSGVLDKAINRAVAKMGNNAAGKIAMSFASEGFEEMFEDAVQPVLQSIYNGQSVGENYSELEISDMLYDGLVGGILGGLGGGVEAIGNRGGRYYDSRTELPKTQTETRSDAEIVNGIADRLFARYDSMIGESGRKAIRGSYQEGKDTAEHVKDFIPAYNAGVEGKANPNPTNETAYAGYVAGQNDAKKEAGTGEHIDSRTKENVSSRNVNAFQFDHPELHSYYSAAAEQIAGIADMSLSRGQQKGARQRTANGYQRSNQIFETPAMRKAMDEGLTRTQIIDAAQRIINDNGQENVKAAKTLEIVLDDMLTNGYTAVDGTAVSPNTDYIAAKQQIAGAEAQATGFDKYVTDNRLALETGEVTMDELRAEYAQQEGAEHGEAVHLREGSERDNGANPRGEVRGVEESTGRDQSRKEGRHFADSEAASLDYGEKVSTASFGIGRGAFNDSVYLVKNETAEMRKAKDLAKERGLRVTFFAGNNLTFRDKSGKAFQVRGYVSGDRVFIRADHPEFTSYQIMRHEAGHDMIAKGEVDLNEVRTRIDKTFTSGEVDSLCTAYADAYAGTEMTAQEIWEEVVCDSLGDMNIFADSEIGDAAAFLLAHIKVESETVAQENSRAPPSKINGRASIEEAADGKKYVRADRQVIFGNDPQSWSEQLEDYINGKIRRGQDVKLIGADGDELALTATSAGKLSDNHTSDGRTMSEAAFERKVNAASHIDELAQISVKGDRNVVDHNSRHGGMASGGWNYRTAFFRDFDGKYYKITISTAQSADGRMIYNIGQMQERSISQIDGSSAANSGALRGDASVDSLSRSVQNVKPKFSGSNTAEYIAGDDAARLAKDSGVNDAQFSREIPEANYEALKEKYGYIPAGERAYREVQVPKKTADDKYVSRTIRTVLEAKATPDAMVPTLERMVAKGDFSYDRYTDKQAISDAESRIKTEGWQKTLNKWKNSTKEGISKENTAIGWALYNNAANSGDVETAIDVLDTIVKRQRNAAQALQATRLLKQQDPSTQLYAAQRSVENLTEDLKKQYGEKAPDLKIDRDLAEKFLNAKDDDARTEAMKEIYRDIGRQMPSRFIDKWNAWRYFSMLGNPRTHVRNIVGNVGFVPAVTVKNIIGAGIESAANAVSGGKVGRTKAILTTKDAGLIKAAWSDYANIREQALGSGKYNDNVNVRQEIEEGRTIFKPKLLEAMRKFNGTALDAEDAWFSKPHYAAALAQFCKANGITAEQVSGGKGIEAAREYAIREAQKATYRDTNAFSQMISDLGRYRGDNKMKRLGSTLAEGILPFRKTPANILVRGVEYSPIGFLKSISYDLVQVQKGNMQATEMIDRAAAGLTGTGLMMLGLYMAKEGILRGSGGDDEKKKKFDELQGHQEYAMELPNGTSITLDWLAPEALPFFVGANLYEQMQANNGYLTMSDMLQAASNVTDPLLSMSCLQSLNDVFDAVGYASSGDTNALTSAVASAATSYLTQGIPTVFGQAERTGESERMTTYTDKNKFLTPDMQYALGKASARIPGVDYGQIPFIDAWGRTESSGGVIARAFNNFANPAYTSKVSGSKMEDELSRLYEATGEAKVLPQRAPKSFTVNKENKQLTGEEYVKYATKRGQTSYKIVSELTGLASYKSMSDGDKADAVAKAYEYANIVGKMSVSNYQTDGWAAKAIDTVKKTGVSEAQYIALYLAKGGIESLKDKNGDTISNSEGLQIMELVYQQKGLSDKQRAALFEDFGVGKKIRHWNRARVDEQLAIARRKAT
jgi:hypothetical protein